MMRVVGRGGTLPISRRLYPCSLTAVMRRRPLFLHATWNIGSSLWRQPPIHVPATGRRFMMGKGLKRRKGKKGGYTDNECRLQICYSPYDLDVTEDEVFEDRQDMTFVRVNFNLESIRETFREVYPDLKGKLEYYNDYRVWQELNDCTFFDDSMQKYRCGKKTLQVRAPRHYDDELWEETDKTVDDPGVDLNVPMDDNDENSALNQNGPLQEGMDDPLALSSLFIERCIRQLVAQLKSEQYVRQQGVVYGENNETKIVYSLVNPFKSQKILTRDWLLQQADRDPSGALGRLFLAVPHSLSHIQQCLHYDCLWREPPRHKTDKYDWFKHPP
jgi:hypothetical protein